MEISTLYNFFFVILQECFFVQDISKNNGDNSASYLGEEYTSFLWKKMKIIWR